MAGNMAINRCTVSAALVVWTVLKTRCPVSAACKATRIVSRSRSSPTRITSGSWRSARRKDSAKLGLSRPISRWAIRLFWDVWTNSMGSSMVMIRRRCCG